MRTPATIGLVCLALLAAALVGYGQTRGQSATPQALYQEWQSLGQEVEALDAELKQLNHEAESVSEARRNYEYVLDRNSQLIKQLQDWAGSE